MANDIPIIGATVAVVKNTDGTHDYVGPLHPLNTTSDLMVDGQKVDATHPVPTTTADQFPTAMTTTDSGVRRMQPITWEAGASVSNAVNLGDHERVSSLLLPATGWATTATRIYFDVSDDGVTWYPAQDLAGNLIYAVVGAAAATKGVTLSDDERARISRRYVRCKSTTDAPAAVTQTAAVSLILGSMNATSANPYSTWIFRVNAGGSISAEVTLAGRVTWAVSDGTGTVTTIGSTLTLSAIAKTVDVVCTAAFAFAGSYINISSSTNLTFKLSDVPVNVSKLRLYNTPLVTGSLNDLNKSLTYLYLFNTPLVTGSLNDLNKSLTYLYLYSTPLVTGSLNDMSKMLTSVYLYNTPLVTGSLNDLSKMLTSVTLNGLPLVTGSLNNLNKSLTYLYLYNTSLVTGSLNDLSKTLTSVTINGLTLVTGSLNDLSKMMTTLYLNNTPLVTGALSTDLPTAVTVELRLVGLPLVTGTFTATQVPAANKAVRCYDCGFSDADTDNMIITLESVGSSNGVAVFETNRTAASDAALTALQGRGWTVTFA